MSTPPPGEPETRDNPAVKRGRGLRTAAVVAVAALALVQGSGPSVEASVDEERVSVGEDLLGDGNEIKQAA